jgi:hypothetical protein
VTLPTDSVLTTEWFFMGLLVEDLEVSEPGIYTAVVTDESNGCISSAGILVLYDDPTFNITLEFSDLTCFDSEDGSIQVFVSGGIEPITYTWSDPIADSTSSTVSMLQAGIYTVMVMDSTGCQSETSVNLLAPPGLIYPVIENEDGDLEVAVPQTNGPYTFLWSTGDTTAILEDPIPNQLYQVTVTDGNVCTSIAEGQLITSSENLIDLGSDISVYPNPTSEKVNIDYKAHQIRSTELSIYTVFGQKINSLKKNDQLTSLSLKGFPDGIYFLEIKTDIGRVVKRVIKN